MDSLQLTYVAVGTLIGLGTVVGFIWKAAWWTSKQFNEVRELIYGLVKQLEDKFDRRHEDNITRFAKLETKLDIAIKNGHS
jgi:hypothetical protein